MQNNADVLLSEESNVGLDLGKQQGEKHLSKRQDARKQTDN